MLAAAKDESVFSLAAALPCASENSRLGSATSTNELHRAFPFANSNTATGLHVCWYDSRVRSRCTGKERDSESGLDYFGARYYGSGLGRFTSPDWSAKPEAVPYADLGDPQSFNQYSYVRNNPLRHVDPDGHDEGEEEEEQERPSLAPPAPPEAPTPVVREVVKRILVFVAESPLLPVVALGILTAQNTSTEDKLNLPPPLMPGQPIPTPPGTGPADPKPPTTENAEHKKGARQSTKEKHESTRSGDKKPPNYVPDREFQKPKEKKSNEPTPTKVHKNKYKKETQDANS